MSYDCFKIKNFRVFNTSNRVRMADEKTTIVCRLINVISMKADVPHL